MSRKASVILFAVACSCTGIPAWSQGLPAGDGKQAVEGACVGCHDLDEITAARHSPDEWRKVVDRMVIIGAPLIPGQIAEVTKYLARSFPGNPMPPAVSVSTRDSVKECRSPHRGVTAASTDRDPAAREVGLGQQPASPGSGHELLARQQQEDGGRPDAGCGGP